MYPPDVGVILITEHVPPRKYVISPADELESNCASESYGAEIVPVSPLPSFTQSTNLKPLVVIVIVHGSQISVSSESVTHSVGVTVEPVGLAHDTTPVLVSTDIPDGSSCSTNTNG